MSSAYDHLGPLYDLWCRSVTEDIPFYVDLALRTGGPVLEIGVGSGRVAVPVALTGVPVVGIDSSAEMLDLAWARALPHRLDMRLLRADMRRLPDLGRFPLIIVPFRAFLHLPDDATRLTVLARLHELLEPGGTLAFDVFHPDRADIEETHGRWIEREPGIHERATWNEAERSLVLEVQAGPTLAEMELWWIDPADWRRLLSAAGYTAIEVYGSFDRAPLAAGSTDSVWVARRRTAS